MSTNILEEHANYLAKNLIFQGDLITFKIDQTKSLLLPIQNNRITSIINSRKLYIEKKSVYGYGIIVGPISLISNYGDFGVDYISDCEGYEVISGCHCIYLLQSEIISIDKGPTSPTYEERFKSACEILKREVKKKLALNFNTQQEEIKFEKNVASLAEEFLDSMSDLK